MADAIPIVEAVRDRLGRRAWLEPGPRPRDLTVRLERADDVPVATAELTALGLGLATLAVTDDEASAGRLVVRWIFEPAAGAPPPLPDVWVTLEAHADPARPAVPSVSGHVPAAMWHEREAQDLFGIAFEGNPDPRPLVVHDGWPRDLHPLRKRFDAAQRPPVLPAEEFPHLEAEGEGVFEVPVGPIHAGIIEPGHFRFSTVGESVLNLDARLFYTHRGLEKRMEGRAFEDAFFVAERICGVCSVSHALGFCEAGERIAGVELPLRALALRTIALELERLYNHVGDVGNVAAGASYHYGTSAGLRMKESLQQLNEQLAGHRFLRGLVAPGGVRQDVTGALARAIEHAIASTTKALDDLVERIENNPTVLDRFDGTGLLTAHDAFALGLTGVAARASGIDRDARRDHPHAGYAVPGAPAPAVVLDGDGDVHARVMVRVKEARESMRIVRTVLGSLPEGSLRAEVPPALPPWKIGIASIESPRGAAVHWLRSDGAGRVDRYHLRSASFANWPAVALAAQSAIVPDFPLVNKSFELCYSCTDR